MKKTFSLLAAALFCSVSARAATYSIDPVHSSISFKVRHFVAKATGRFNKFSGTFDYTEGKPKTWKVDATIDPATVDTSNEKRDGHLRTGDFFDVEKCPEMKFKSTKVVAGKGGAHKLHGDLTMHCVTKPVVLDLEIGGVSGSKFGATATGKIKRKDFNMTWNKAMDKGGVVLGEDVDVAIDIEGDLKQ
jgi:polyisoprenoid-binding protein YceI